VAALIDPRHGNALKHSYLGMTRARVHGILAGYEDQNDQVVMAALLFGTASPTLGVVDDLKYLVTRIRAVWPDVQITIRVRVREPLTRPPSQKPRRLASRRGLGNSL
jgi:hypothetical protein